MASLGNLNLRSQSPNQEPLPGQNLPFRPIQLLEASLTFQGRECLEVEDRKQLRRVSKHLKDLVDSLSPLTGINIEDKDGDQIPVMLRDCSKILPRMETLRLPYAEENSADQATILASHTYSHLKYFSFSPDYGWDSILTDNMLTRLTTLTALDIRAKEECSPEVILKCLAHTNLRTLKQLEISNFQHVDRSSQTLDLAVNALANLSNLQNLNMAYLGGLSLMDAPRLFPHEDSLVNLTELGMDACRYVPPREEAFRQVCPALLNPTWPKLKALDLVTVTNQSILDLVMGTNWFKELKVLNLAFLCDASNFIFDDVSQASKLEELNIFWPFGSPDFRGIKLQKLKKLLLHGGFMDGEGIGLEGVGLDLSHFPVLEEFTCECRRCCVSFYIDLNIPPSSVLKKVTIEDAVIDDEHVAALFSAWISKCEHVCLKSINEDTLDLLFSSLADLNPEIGPNWPHLRILNIAADAYAHPSHQYFLFDLKRVAVHCPRLTHFYLKFLYDFQESLEQFISINIVEEAWPELEEFWVHSPRNSMRFKRSADGNGLETVEYNTA